MERYAVAIDVGGTFTDVILADLEQGSYQLLKIPSTPQDPSEGFLKGLSEVLETAGVKPQDLRHIFHGTTIATNAILEGKGARVGLLVSEGFKYVLEIARQGMPRLASQHAWVKPQRPIPPEHVFEVAERVSFVGEVITPLDETAVLDAADRLRDAGIDSIAVSFIHSYADGANERRAAELIAQAYPDARVSLSSEVLPVFREYERTMTTALNAYVMPQVSYYIENLEKELHKRQVQAPLFIMKSSGGVIGVETAVRQPVYTALSGPAAGVMAARHIGQATGFENVISFDMGGTSTDVSLIEKGRVSITAEGMLGDWPIQLPMVDIVTIGAGGGSIAWLSQTGNLSVGPQSAGARPGPACYGLGGAEPTVTDANLVLGRISSSIAGGQLNLDGAVALDVVRDRLARPMGIDAHHAASGVIRIVNNAMMGAIRNVSVERGHDPGQFALVAFGGAGPMHAVGVAQLLGISVVVVPLNPGVSSAQGLLVSDFKNDFARTFLQKPPDYDMEGMETVYRDLEREALRWLDYEKIPDSDRVVSRSADLRYMHQGFEVAVDLEGGVVDLAAVQRLIENFHGRHRQVFGFSLDQPVEVVTLRVSAVGRLHSPATPVLQRPLGQPEDAVLDQRKVFFEEVDSFVACDTYRRSMVAQDSTIQGPAILEGVDSTVVINPGWVSQIDRYGNCILRREV